MTRRVPVEFADKVAAVDAAVEGERREIRRSFHVTEEVRPDVRLVMTQSAGHPVIFSLWTDERDVAELCGDAAYPAAEGLLAIDKSQVADLGRLDVAVDLASLVRSETVPGLYYTLFDHLSDQALRRVVGAVLPSARGADGDEFR